MRERRQGVERRRQIVGVEHVLVIASLRGRDQRAAAARAREQHAALLERLADRGRSRGALGIAVAPDRILRLHLAAGKDQRAGREVNLVVAHHHEHFEAARAVAHEQNGGGGAGGRDFAAGRGRHSERHGVSGTSRRLARPGRARHPRGAKPPDSGLRASG